MNNKLLIGLGVLMLLGVASAKSNSVAKPAIAPTAVHHMAAKPALKVARASQRKHQTKRTVTTHRVVHHSTARKTK